MAVHVSHFCGCIIYVFTDLKKCLSVIRVPPFTRKTSIVISFSFQSVTSSVVPIQGILPLLSIVFHLNVHLITTVVAHYLCFGSFMVMLAGEKA